MMSSWVAGLGGRFVSVFLGNTRVLYAEPHRPEICTVLDRLKAQTGYEKYPG